MRHPKLDEWEKKLESLMNDVDDFLEDKYGQKFKLHPARQKRGKTSNRSNDGLFNIAASFTLGTGSKFGRGYVVDVHLSTLEKIPAKIIDEIEEQTLEKIRERISSHFPNIELKVDLDGNVIKIFGDLSLGTI